MKKNLKKYHLIISHKPIKHRNKTKQFKTIKLLIIFEKLDNMCILLGANFRNKFTFPVSQVSNNVRRSKYITYKLLGARKWLNKTLTYVQNPVIPCGTENSGPVLTT